MMADCSSMESMLSSTIPPLIANIISVTLTCICLAFFDWRMALAIFCTMPVTFLIIWCGRKLQLRLFDKQVDVKLEASSQIQEYLEGIKIIKSCGLSGSRFSTLDKALQAMRKIAIKVELCSLVVGTSARSRTLPWPMLEPRECGVRSAREAEHAPVALVFGRERVGLTNEELQKCHYHVAIPANPEYSSLNLAMAVQILAYEVRVAFLDRQQAAAPRVEEEEAPYPLVDDLERFYLHLGKFYPHWFYPSGTSGQIMSKLRRLFTRARPEAQELNILRGMLTSIEKQDKYPQRGTDTNAQNDKKIMLYINWLL